MLLKSLAFSLALVLVACGSEGDATQGPRGDALYGVSGAIFAPDGTTSYVAIVDSLDPGTEVDLDAALTFSGGGSIATSPLFPGVFFVGLAEEPTIQRYRVADDGGIDFDGEFSLAGLGFMSAVGVRNPIHVIDTDEAYFVDTSTFQIVPFDPTAMELLGGSVSIDGLAEDGLRVGGNYVHQDGDRLVLSTRYFRDDGTAAVLGRVVIFDTTDQSVTYDEETVCANLATSMAATNGDIYFASHSAQAVRHAGGLAGDPSTPPCMVRMRAGSDGFDDDFFVDLEATAGRPAGFLIPGSGDTGFVLSFDDQANPVTPENVTSLTAQPIWSYEAIDLTDPTSTTRLTDFGLTAAYGISSVVEVGPARTPTPAIASIAGDFSEGTFFDVSDPDDVVELLTGPGFILNLLRIR